MAATIDHQRKNYLLARQALDRGQSQKFQQLAQGLKDYPLYSYLKYYYTLKHLGKLDNLTIAKFIANHDDLPMTNYLHKVWLKNIAKRGQWSDFMRYYTPQTDHVLLYVQNCVVLAFQLLL